MLCSELCNDHFDVLNTHITHRKKALIQTTFNLNDDLDSLSCE